MRRLVATLGPLAIPLAAFLAQARAAEALAHSLAEFAGLAVFEPGAADDTPGMDIPEGIGAVPVKAPAPVLSSSPSVLFEPAIRPAVAAPSRLDEPGPSPPPSSSRRLARLQSLRC